MSALTNVSANVWRWDGVDVDQGFPIVGYVVPGEEGILLVDPPATSGTVEEIKACGEPEAIMLTSGWHVRGSAKWQEAFGVPIVAPDSAASELAEVGAKADKVVSEGDEYKGWSVLLFEAGTYSEVAYWHAASSTVIIGDLITQREIGQLALGPTIFFGLTKEDLAPFINKLIALQPKLLLSAHIGPRENVVQMLSGLLDG